MNNSRKLLLAAFLLTLCLCLFLAAGASQCAFASPASGKWALFLAYAAIGLGLCLCRSRRIVSGCLALFLAAAVTFVYLAGACLNPRQGRREYPSPDGAHILVVETDLADRPTVYEKRGAFLEKVFQPSAPFYNETYGTGLHWLDTSRFVLIYGEREAWIMNIDTHEVRDASWVFDWDEGYTVTCEDGSVYQVR